MEVPPWILPTAGAAALAWHVWKRKPSKEVPLHLVKTPSGSQVMLIDVRLGDGSYALFQVDTAFGGPPMLSKTYLSQVPPVYAAGNVQKRYSQAANAKGGSEDGAGEEAVERFLARCKNCRTFASGCSMQLMSIDAIQTHHSDLILAPALQLQGKLPSSSSSFESDVLLTHSLPGSVHILTLDYMMHRSPVLIQPGKITFHASLSWYDSFRMVEVRHVAGVFAIPIEVDGVGMEVMLDTGSSTGLTLNRSAFRRLPRGTNPSSSSSSAVHKHIVQRGVNGERTCNNLSLHRIVLAGYEVDADPLPVMVKATDGSVSGEVDGYMGLPFLRAFDLWMEQDKIGVRPSGKRAKGPPASVLREGKCPA